MTRPQLNAMLRFWVDMLRIGHWDVRIDFDVPASDNNHATCHWPFHYDEAFIRLDKEWRAWSSERAERILIHELLHLVLRDQEVAIKGLISSLDDDAQNLAEYVTTHETEGVVDRLANSLYELRHGI